MLQLTPNEARALGVLIEKSTTTPDQYPLSINALTAGCNQKNNRDPVLNLTEDEVFTAVEGLREKQLTVRVDAIGSRVHKHRHEVQRVLNIGGAALAVFAELLLRGPQTLGELRGRASRMHPINTLEEAQVAVQALCQREEPLAREMPPAPGSRAPQYVQLVSPESHPAPATAATPAAPFAVAVPGLSDRVAKLEQEVSDLRSALTKLAAAVGEPDPLAAGAGATEGHP